MNPLLEAARNTIWNFANPKHPDFPRISLAYMQHGMSLFAAHEMILESEEATPEERKAAKTYLNAHRYRYQSKS